MEKKVYEGGLDASNLNFAIVASRFNDLLTKNLVEGALDSLNRHNAKSVEIFWVPGSFEIPIVAKKVAMNQKKDAIICLGALIRGKTPHFEYLSATVTKSLAEISREGGVPIAFGIITTDSLEQAIERAGTKQGNKGFITAENAIEMANLCKKIE
ncbi:MAG TPA: 6,7-dimethyl-8-ribityllumazine synthase [Thermoplasmata archaeon]|nr:6,7-dimethyl-8-ribityllumazine synthase [Thermoplasmata archaeon]HIH98503.1 6,7-dimethyl-8-ribityllumazine synthase [Thermoplasmata archaeon]